MKIFISTDTYNKTAIETGERLREICLELETEILEDCKDADIVFSVGGDGTFLETSKLAKGLPVIGINCGTLGFLTEINPDDLKEALEAILKGQYYIEERMMLEGEILKENGDSLKIPNALNEIALSKNTFGVVRFDAFVDGKLINSYTADGIIISTPTGSTAYNLSCGGPIVDPTAKNITLTPIAAHSLLNRSIVLSYKSEVSVKITELRNETKSYVLSDGKPLEVSAGDTVIIRKSNQNTKILKLNWRSFVDAIRENIR